MKWYIFGFSMFLLKVQMRCLLLRLWDEGHMVVGVEYVPKALDEFFSEHNIEYTVEDIPSIQAKLYKVR